MLTSVVLIHKLADGATHFDWMIQEPSGQERCLLTWQCADRPDGADWSGSCSQIGAHRRVYLGFEGDLSEGRGHVSRLASGVVLELIHSEQNVDATIRWADCVLVYRGQPSGEGGGWEFSVRRLAAGG